MLSGLTVVGCVWSLGSGVLPAALEAVALTVHFQDVYVVGERSSSAPVSLSEPNTSVHSSKGEVSGYQGGAPCHARADVVHPALFEGPGSRCSCPRVTGGLSSQIELEGILVKLVRPCCVFGE